MNKTIMWTMIQKELRQVFRNKRVIIGLLLPLVLYPILFHVYMGIMSDTEEKAAAEISQVVLLSQIPVGVATDLVLDDRLHIVENVSSGVEGLQEKKYDIGINYLVVGDQETFQFHYDSGRSTSRKAHARVLESISKYEETIQEIYLADHGAEENALTPFILEIEDIADQTAKSSKSLGDILPMLLTITALLSVVNFAIEMTTGEKEVGTLETLFSLPITRSEIVFSKLCASVFLGVLAMLLNVVAVYLLLPSIINSGDVTVSLGGETLLILVLTLLPLILMGAGASLGVGMFANSYKESSAFITPLTFVFMIPAYIGMIPGVELNELLAAIPIVNSTLLIKSVFLNTFQVKYFTIGFLTNILFAACSMIFVFKVFGTEKILFGSGKGLSFRLKRTDIKPRTFIEVQDALLIVALSIIVFVYVGGVASNAFGLVGGTMFIQYLSFLILPLIFTWYLKADIKEAIHAKIPRMYPCIAGIFLWLGTLSLMLVYQLAIVKFVPEAPTLVGLEEEMNKLSFIQQFIFIAVTPGICEEILYRGVAFRPLEKALGPKKAVVITALFFALMHMDVVRLVPTFLLGILFGYVAYKSGSILPAMFLHVLNNSIAAFTMDSMPISMLPLLTFSVSTFAVGFMILQKKPFDRRAKEAYNVVNK